MHTKCECGNDLSLEAIGSAGISVSTYTIDSGSYGYEVDALARHGVKMHPKVSHLYAMVLRAECDVCGEYELHLALEATEESKKLG